MNWISKHTTEHKANLLNEMPIDDHASKGPKLVDPEKKAQKAAKKYLKSVKNDPRREQKLDSINKEYFKQFNDFDLGRDPGKNFDKNHYISKFSGRDVPFGMEGPLDKCAKSEGGSGCIKKVGGSWRVESNKTGKLWPAKYKSESSAKAGLRGYHAG